MPLLFITLPFQEERLEVPFIVQCRAVAFTELGGSIKRAMADVALQTQSALGCGQVLGRH